MQLLLLFVLSASADDAKPEPGFRSLFDGKTLAGWKTKTGNELLADKTEAYKGRVKVIDGVLVIDPKVKGDVIIETTDKLKDVHIKFEFKPDARCNNDLFLRGMKFDIIPKMFKSIKLDDWNTLEIVAQDAKAVVKINGDVVREQKLKTAESPFGIRAEYGGLQIRRLQMKHLP